MEPELLIAIGKSPALLCAHTLTPTKKVTRIGHSDAATYVDLVVLLFGRDAPRSMDIIHVK